MPAVCGQRRPIRLVFAMRYSAFAGRQLDHVRPLGLVSPPSSYPAAGGVADVWREKQRSRSTCACVLLIIVGDRAVGCRGLYAASVQCYSTTALPCKTISTSVRNLTISSDHLHYLLSALFSSCLLSSLKKSQKSPHSYYLKSFPQCVPLPSSFLWPWLLSPWPRIN
jgi:hypothetical protein